jgi:hypothetical protein
MVSDALRCWNVLRLRVIKVASSRTDTDPTYIVTHVLVQLSVYILT